MQPIHVFPIWQVRHAPVRIWQVGAVQLELTRTAASRDQTCAAVKTLEQLAALGFEFRQVPNDVVDREVPMRAWRSAGVWESLPRFPSDAAKAAHAAGGRARPRLLLPNFHLWKGLNDRFALGERGVMFDALTRRVEPLVNRP